VLLNTLARGLAVAVLTAVMFAPTLAEFAGGTSERSAITFAGLDHDYESLIKPIVTLETGDPFALERQVFLAALAFLGAGVWLMRQQIAWALGWASVMTLTFLAGTSGSWLVEQLT